MQMIMNYIFIPLQDLGTIILAYREAETSLQNFDLLMKKPVETRPEEPIELGTVEKLEFKNVVFRHKTAIDNSIDDISFKVHTGESIAFAGPSGSDRVQLTVWPLGGPQVHPPPVAEIGLRPEGTVSVTVTVPLVAPAPEFVTTIE